ncbi:hypothetical protein [Hymenobacter koreensis]|uniref:Uncharacterized protein n=1 Tax=Hymenobacter koreensis TaxID=1084523 RepID=A0ABP8JN88_9BACT
MCVQTLPRPKPAEKKVNANYRVSETLREKFAYACEKQRTDATKQVVGFMEDFVASYEAAHGPITLPPLPPSP